MKTKNVTVLEYFILTVGIVIFLGCAAPKQPGLIVKPYYQSKLITKKSKTNSPPIYIKIDPIKFDTPAQEISIPIGLTKILPLISLLPTKDERQINLRCSENGWGTVITRESGEIEEIVMSEIIKAYPFCFVNSQENSNDYIVRGKVDFILESNTHTCGLGLWLWAGLILPISLVPGGTDYFICKAHFELISTKENRVVFSKDYLHQEKLLQSNLLKLDLKRYYCFWGKNIFPVIVEKFINDLDTVL